MKRFLKSGLLVMAFTQLASSQTYTVQGSFSAPPSVPPTLEYPSVVNFLNPEGSTFDVTIPLNTWSTTLNNYSIRTLNLTNRGSMTLNPGFTYETVPQDYVAIPGVPYASKTLGANFINEGNGFGGGTINCTGNTTNLYDAFAFNSVGFPPLLMTGNAQLTVAATNIENSGAINMNASSLLSLRGKNINLNRGQLRQSTPMDIFTVSNGVPLNLYFLFSGSTIDLGAFWYYTGILDGYWGTGIDPYFDPSSLNVFDPQVTPLSALGSPAFFPVTATTRGMKTIDPRPTLDHVKAYVATTPVNFFGGFETTVVFLRNTNPAISASVFIEPEFLTNTTTGTFVLLANDFSRATVQYHWTNTDFQTGATTTNYATLTDSYRLNATNFVQFFTSATNYPNTFWHGNVGSKFTFQPANFMLTLAPYITSNAPATEASSPLGVFQEGIFNTSIAQYSAYQAIFSASAQLPGTEIHTDVTNMPGRIEISADNALDLTDSRISALSYLLLQATNHFIGSDGALIQSPNMDVLLRSTNGTLTITNLVVPFLSTPDGKLNCYSLIWQDFQPLATNWFHVLFIDTQFDPVTKPKIQTLSLMATNLGSTSGSDSIIINDSLNVTRNMLLDAQQITVAANGDGAFSSKGQLNILNNSILWSVATPRLQFLTNNGIITAPNFMNFAGNMSGPFSEPQLSTPYQTFINHGGVTNRGSFIRANYFVNDGVFQTAGSGSFTLIANCAYLTNGTISAEDASGSISITAANLSLSNQVLRAGGSLSISPTDCFSDGFAFGNMFGHVVDTNTPVFNVVSNGNFWAFNGSFGFLAKPATGDLLGTTISNTAAPLHNNVITWAGSNLGDSPAGFANNLAVGRLILNGSANSKFTFTGTGAANAIYVDRLELVGTATNLGPAGLTNITIAPNMRVYYAQATANGVSIAELLQMSGRNNGRFNWVSNYAGIFSATNITYTPSFVTYTFNQALVESQNIDSDGDSTVNRFDPSPIPLGWVFDVTVDNTPCSCDADTVASLFAGPLHSGHPGGLDSAILKFPSDDSHSTNSSSGSVSNLFTLTQGNYNGLFYDTNGVSAASAGYFKAKLTKAGHVTGALKLAGKTYPFSGAFDLSGHFIKSNLFADKRSLRLSLDTQLDPIGGGQITGSVISSNWMASLRADRLSSKNKNRFTFAIPGDDVSNPSSPSGHGYGTLRVQADGSVQWSGALGDGTSIPETQFSGISSEGLLPLYYAPYSGAGLFLGWIHFDTNQPDSDFSGDTIWIKPSGLGSKYKYYPAGFTNVTEVKGSTFVSPTKSPTNATVILTGGNLTQSAVSELSIKSNFKTIKQGTNQVNLNIGKTDGVFQGDQITSINRKTKFQGVLLQKMGAGYGFFLGTNQSGQVWYGPLP